MTKYLLLIPLFFLSLNLKAQTWEVGLSGGAAGYMGDLNANNPVKVSGGSFGGFLQRNFDGYWSAKVSFNHGNISGNDANSSDAQFRERNLSFSTPLDELALVGSFNFFNYIPEIGKNRFTPFIYGGLSRTNYTPTAMLDGVDYDLRSYETEGKSYPSSTISILYGVGVKYNIAGRLTLSADFGYRNTNTDYLDDVSGYYPEAYTSTIQQELSNRSGNAALAGSQRGDLNPHDSFFFTQVSISYTFITQKCYFER